MGALETEGEKRRSETASFLRDLADQRDGGGDVTLELGGRQGQIESDESSDLQAGRRVGLDRRRY
jgi:hypothetical protein